MPSLVRFLSAVSTLVLVLAGPSVAAESAGSAERAPGAAASAEVQSVPAKVASKPLTGVGLARFTDIFTPFRTDQASLSPDGKHLAFSWYDGRELSVAVVALADPRVVKFKVIVGHDPETPRRNTYPGEYAAARITFLSWVSATRVALQANTRAVFSVGTRQAEVRGVWFAFDVDGSEARVLFDPRDVTVDAGRPGYPRALPAMFSAVDVDPDLNDGVYLRRTKWDYTNPRKPEAIPIWHRVDARTGQVRELREKERILAEQAVAARRARFAAELRAAHGELSAVLPNQTIDLVGCDEKAGHFLARVQGGADAGSFHVFDRPGRKSYELIRRAEHLDTARIVSSVAFEFPAAEGPPLRGMITLPRQARLRPFPVVVICPRKSNDKHLSTFRPEILAFADMGLAVVQIEGAVARMTDRAEIAALAPEQESARVIAALDALAAKHPITLKRVMLYGETQGALLALRTAHLHPERFRGVVAVRPALASGQWSDDRLLRALRTRQPPIQLISYPGPTARDRDHRQALQLASALRRHGGSVELYSLTADDLTAVPQARAKTFREIESFINASLYDYTVELGDLREVEETATEPRPAAPAP